MLLSKGRRIGSSDTEAVAARSNAYQHNGMSNVAWRHTLSLLSVSRKTGNVIHKRDIHMKNPAHPGGEIVEPLGLPVTAAAQVLGITRAALSTFLNQRAFLSPHMAIRIQKAFGVSMETLMRMQNTFDIAQALRREGEIQVQPYVAKIKTEPQPKLFSKHRAM
jgi:addiction module HigA family antidote